jgi:lysophospholipid acyltransferase (LPLAT)-like uncharacterized protein
MIEKLLPIVATVVARTLRFRWKSAKPTAPAVIMFWHGSMVAGWYAVRSLKPVALVSKSKDGGILAAVLAAWGFRLVRGSSTKQGREALAEAIEDARTGRAGIIAITPDGPRGPRMKYKRGAFAAAKELDVPLYHLHISYSRKRTLQSWDKFEVPLPFSGVDLRAERIDYASYPDELEPQRTWLDALAERTTRETA